MSNRWLMLSMTGMHRALVRLTGGRLGSRLGAMPVIELTTRGRRTGAERTTLLTIAARTGNTFVVVASRGGDDAHPAWYLNLVDDPDVRVGKPGKESRPMLARVAGDAERERLWPEIVRAYRGYAAYQRKTTRRIPLVILEPLARTT
ncbi:nitroreductase/quinone reductase family protein [Chryseoglobus sp. 28M-23]|uniref:nitroreductase/quinone reductase family protein n=1 Tax=Chryseoglobus sp. 28M-23 TaxID=2772253 RepID=UPI001747C068|nr:nitroreductase/quinone reductase family protein [Chryseoglobus sp. 28M-23]QOD93650.1 nitroreductase family deazaflavin-dependent oxidoreductase [Chryseoglobus sp. 28M-23]